MAAPGKPSRWGSFLSQAVAGVESRLDNILTEQEEERSAAQAAPAANAKTASSQQAALARTSSATNSRASSTNRANDRLQARLAKAMANKSAPAVGKSKGTVSPRCPIEDASRASMERPCNDMGQGSKPEPPPTEPTPESSSTQTTPVYTGPTTVTTEPSSVDIINPTQDIKVEPVFAAAASNESTTSGSLETEVAKKAEELVESSTDHAINSTEVTCQLEEVKSRHQDEIQEYVERIDSLQSKLQYMSKSAADSAKMKASSVPSGSVERKLAEKDEQIALLMGEGQMLASAEQKYRATIKMLRLQNSEHHTRLEEYRKGMNKALADAEVLRNHLNGSGEREKRQQEALKAMAALQKEVELLEKDRSNKNETIRRLEQEARLKVEQAETANALALSKALIAEREIQKKLENANATLRADLETLGEKVQLDTIEWGETLDRAVERGRSVEAELRLELQVMESKLEGMRATAEEAASGSGGESQVKLFRHIETLQSQYGSARENWQGIETSLLAKTTELEKERDEAQRRESEMRKKARDAASRCRVLEDEVHDTQQDLATCREQLATLCLTSKAAEAALEQARAELAKEKRAASKELTAEAEQRQWVDDVAGATSENQSRPDSPLLSVPRTFSSDMVGLPVGRSRRVLTPGSIPDGSAEGLGIYRRPPTQLLFRTSTMPTTGSAPPPPAFSPFESPSELSTVLPLSMAEGENGIGDTASSPRDMAQDTISASTVAAGPSVQLVERMSAAIRRLEAERVAAKEEMARICCQRDEARGDMASLMKELEEAKTAASTVPKLKKEVEDLDARYQTTLELLGEKSELVDELKADVEDVKVIYRELVERTVG